ncbi:MAG: hypothetical protein R3E86_13005 [Pseudomonadales bacterium]
MTFVHSLIERFRPTSERGRRTAAAALIVGGTVLTSASIFATGPQATPEPPQEKAWPVSVMTVVPQSLQPTFTAFGRVESNNVANLRTDLVAAVENVYVREGDWVEAGDLLVELTAAEVALSVDERRAELAQNRAELRSIEMERDMLDASTAHYESMAQIARTRLERHRELLERRLISQSLLDEVVAQANEADIRLQNHQRALADFPNRLAAQKALVARAEAQLAQAELDLRKTRVVAPFTGPVLAVHVAPGDRSSLGAPLVEMADAQGFEVRVQVPADYETRLQRYLQQGIPVRATAPDHQQLQLSRLGGRVKSGQSGLDAFFAFAAQPDGSVPAIGRVLDLVIELPAEPALVALPVSALYENDRVYAVRDRRLQAINVTRVGEQQLPDGEYRVLVRSADLNGDERIITTQLPKAISGLLVETPDGARPPVPTAATADHAGQRSGPAV